MTTEIYSGNRERVLINGAPLDPRHDLAHIADHFDWNCDANNLGAAQLALAILAHHCGSDEQRALDHYAEFSKLIIAHIPCDHWMIDREYIEDILKTLEHQTRQVA